MWDELEKILREMGINYQRKEESFICLFQREKSKIWVVLKILELGKEAYLLQAKVPQLCKIGESDRQKTTEKINEINQRLQYGVIILDPEDGEAYYGWTIPIEKELRGQEVSLFLSLVINLVESLSSEISALPGTNKSEPEVDSEQTSRNQLNAALEELNRLIQEDKSNTEDRRIELCRYLLGIIDKNANPEIWAQINVNLGDVFLDRYSRDNHLEDFENAKQAYITAFEAFVREKYPVGWAITNYKLGTLYCMKFDRENQAEDFVKADKAYISALEVFTMEQYPSEFAATLRGMGSLYAKRYEQDNNAEGFRSADEAFLGALEIYTKEYDPSNYCITTVSRGDLYLVRYERENEEDDFCAAEEAYLRAKEICTKGADPLLYAEIKYCLGKLHHLRFKRNKESTDFECADQAYLAALEIYNKEQYPGKHAAITNDRDKLHDLR